MAFMDRAKIDPRSRPDDFRSFAFRATLLFLAVWFVISLACVPRAFGIAFGEAALFVSACRVLRLDAAPRWLRSSAGDVSPILVAWLWLACLFGFGLYPAHPFAGGRILHANLVNGISSVLVATLMVVFASVAWIAFQMNRLSHARLCGSSRVGPDA